MANNKNVLNNEIEYTEEQIKSIKENLYNAFGIDYIPVEINLKNLLKNSNIDKFDFEVGENYVFYNSMENNTLGINEGWHRLKITYQRCDLVFFKILTSDKPRIEQYANKSSIFVNNLIPTKINLSRFNIPEKNLAIIRFVKDDKNPFEIEVIKNNNNSYTI